jgi:UMF1 family MFS transporter
MNINPFKSLPNPREVWAWGMFDLANQSFTLIINTLLFAIFLSDVVLSGHKHSDLAWSIFGSVSLGIVVIISPILGAIADARAAKKKFLISSGIACALLTCALALIPSGSSIGVPGALAIAALLYIPANITFNLGENFLASFLPEIATRKTIGRISAIGWTMGYAGALTLLILVALFSNLFNIKTADQYRPLFLFAGLWFAIVMLPTLFFLRESAKPTASSRTKHPVRTAIKGMRDTVRQSTEFKDLFRLLTAFLVYAMGIQVIIFFGGKIAKDDFSLPPVGQALFLVTITVSAAIAAIVVGKRQDRIGHARTLFTLLALWIATALLLAVTVYLKANSANPDAFPQAPLWIAGIGVGLGLGGAGTATRAAVGALTPAHRAAEFFGLWGASYKLAGVIGLPLFGVVRSLLGSAASFIILAAFFVVGALILAKVDFNRGHAAAEQSEQEHADEITPEDLAAKPAAIPPTDPA